RKMQAGRDLPRSGEADVLGTREPVARTHREVGLVRMFARPAEAHVLRAVIGVGGAGATIALDRMGAGASAIALVEGAIIRVGSAGSPRRHEVGVAGPQSVARIGTVAVCGARAAARRSRGLEDVGATAIGRTITGFGHVALV